MIKVVIIIITAGSYGIVLYFQFVVILMVKTTLEKPNINIKTSQTTLVFLESGHLFTFWNRFTSASFALLEFENMAFLTNLKQNFQCLFFVVW